MEEKKKKRKKIEAKEVEKENLSREAARSCSGILAEDKRRNLRGAGIGNLYAGIQQICVVCRASYELVSRFSYKFPSSCSCCTFPLNFNLLVACRRDCDIAFNFNCAYQVPQSANKFDIASHLI